jgi:hypothetical protein
MRRGGERWTIGAWAGLFFPALWMVLAGFKREVDAAGNPPTRSAGPRLTIRRGTWCDDSRWGRSREGSGHRQAG